MTWATSTALRWGKRPIWLFEFTRSGSTSYFTSALSSYTDLAAQVWTQKNIAISRVVKTSVGERAAIKITFPKTDAFAQSFRNDLSFEENIVKIHHEYRAVSPAERKTKFYGRVIGIEETIATITLVAENDFTLLRGRGTTTALQRPCRHAHYHLTVDGYGCPAVLANFQVAGTLTALSGGTIATVGSAASSADGHYTRGIIEWNGLKQLISVHAGTTLELHRPIQGLEAALAGSGSESVLIAPGCPGTRAACDGTFNSLTHHGGFPWSDEFIGDGRTLF